MPTPNRAGGVGRSQYGPGLKVLYTGPFFERDPAKTFRQNGKAFIDAVVDDAYQTALDAAPVHRGFYRAALRRQYGGVKPGSRRRWEVTGVVSLAKLAAPWPGNRRPKGIRGDKYNYAGHVEARYHVFRKARSRIYSARRHNIDLLRGLR